MHFLFKRTLLMFFSWLILSSLALSAQDTTYVPYKPPKNRDILDRIDFGGYLGAQFGSVTYIQLSPLASYRVTKNFYAGLGLTYQYYKDTRYTPDYSTSSYGGSIFGRYFVWGDLFVHAEYAPLYVNYYDYDYLGNWVKGSTWINDFLVGGGYRQMIGERSYLSLMLLWNVNESYYSPYRNPIIRIGFGVGL